MNDDLKFSEELIKLRDNPNQRCELITALKLLKQEDNSEYNIVVDNYIITIEKAFRVDTPDIESSDELKEDCLALQNYMRIIDDESLRLAKENLLDIFANLHDSRIKLKCNYITDFMGLICERDFNLQANFKKHRMGYTSTVRNLLLTCLGKEIVSVPIFGDSDDNSILPLVDIELQDDKLFIKSKFTALVEYTITIDQNQLVVATNNVQEKFIWIASAQYRTGHHFIVYFTKDKILGEDQRLSLNGKSLRLTIEILMKILTGKYHQNKERIWGQTEDMILIRKDDFQKWPPERYGSIENKKNNCWFVAPLFTALLVHDITEV